MREPDRYDPTVPTPVGRIDDRQSTGDRTVSIVGCRLTPEALEGRVLVFRPDHGPGIEPRFREPGAYVRGAVLGPRRGEVLVLLPGNLGACVPAACAGDLVYLEEEIGRARAAAERREVEAWKAERRAGA